MKKIITTLAFALAIGTMAHAEECTSRQSASKPTPDAKLLSSTVEGDTEVSTWLVKQTTPDQTGEFRVKYQINLTRLISSYGNNAKELEGLHSFMGGVMDDDMKKIVRVEINGYASPDGPAALNKKLSAERADDCCEYLKGKYDFTGIPTTTNGIALGWDATEAPIENSSTPDKSSVLSTVESSMAAPAIESKLRSMTNSWDYIKAHILPPLRCVEINVVYNAWDKVVTRTPLQPEVEEVVLANNYYIFVEDSPSNIIAFENCATPIDFDDAKTKFKVTDRRHRAKVKEALRDKYGRRHYLWHLR